MKPSLVLQVLVNLLVCVSLSVADDFYELLGVDKQATAKEIRKAFKKVALVAHPDKNLDDPDAHDNFLKINRAYEVLKDEELRKKYDLYGEDGLKEDGPSGRGYQSWKFYKQDFGIYDDDREIITLSKTDFEQSVDNTEDIWFINYYSPGCGHCHDLAPTWREVAKELEGVVRIGAVNCGDDWALCRQQGIRSYPSLVMYPQREKYHGERTRRELVKHALRHNRVPVVELWDGNFDSEIEDEEHGALPWVISFCGDGGDCLEGTSALKLAAMLAELTTVATVNCHSKEELCARLGKEYGTYYYPAGEVARGKGMEITSLDAREIALIVLRELPEVTPLDGLAFKNVERGSDPWLVHFVDGETEDLELRKLPALLRDDAKVGRVDCRVQRTECNRLHVHKFPTFAVFKSDGGHEFHHGRQTAHDVAAFARDSAATPVRVLGPTDFPNKVVNSRQPWFVDFYAPWCPPCMRLLPEFRKASKQIMGRVNFGTVDCTVHSTLCSKYNIHAYPTTIFYNDSVPHTYQGHHQVNHMVEFLEDTLKPIVVRLTGDTFQKSVGQKAKGDIWLVEFYAPWCGPCQQLAPEWRSLARMLKDMDEIHIGQVDCDEAKALCQTQKVRGYPAIRLYPPGSSQASKFHEYNGWYRDAQSIRAWALGYLPSAATDLSGATFTASVLRSQQAWLVDFYTPWCGHCQVFAPEFERVAKALDGRVKAGKVDCDQNQRLCQQAGIRAYPTVRFYQGAHSGGQQGYNGEEINSQRANDIIKQLKNRVPASKIPKDEL